MDYHANRPVSGAGQGSNSLRTGPHASVFTGPLPATSDKEDEMKLFALTGVAAAASIAVGAAVAQPPSQSSETVPYAGVQDCGAFEIEYAGTATVHETIYYNGDGNPIRVQIHVRTSETDVNTSTNESIDVRGTQTNVIDLVAGTFIINGQVFMSNQPGQGALLQDTGRITFNPDGSVVVRGPHEVFETDAEIFCEALS